MATGRTALALALATTALSMGIRGNLPASLQMLKQSAMLCKDRPKKKNKFGNRQKERMRRKARAKQRRGR
jgi:hypothetical protein